MCIPFKYDSDLKERKKQESQIKININWIKSNNNKQLKQKGYFHYKLLQIRKAAQFIYKYNDSMYDAAADYVKRYLVEVHWHM